MPETPQDRGREFEAELAKLYGGEQVPGSGSGVRKLDVGRKTIILSAKHTDDKSIRITEEMLRELEQATTGAGGYGSSVIGIMAIRIDGIGRRVALLDLDDQLEILTEDIRVVEPHKRDVRRARSHVPGLLRDE